MSSLVQRCLPFVTLLGLVQPIRSQTVVPVSSKLPPPMGLRFIGNWRCIAGPQVAQLVVNTHALRKDPRNISASGEWAMLTERQQGISAHLVVGYDRDAKQFLLFDADDPGYQAFSTTGWVGQEMILTSIDRPERNFPQHRFVYRIKDARLFTVSWELRQEGAWKAQDTFTCAKQSRDSLN
jgi:hypothetical protein